MTMMNFTIFNFLLYSIAGWLIEGIYSYVICGKFKKEGFMKGPYKPMYGIAFTILVLFNKYLDLNLAENLVISLIVPTTVEFISGYLLKEIFNKQYWDYSKLKCNYKGLITLRFSIYWMILCYIGIKLVQPIINSMYLSLERFFKILNVIGLFIMLFDFIITVKMLYRAPIIQN